MNYKNTIKLIHKLAQNVINVPPTTIYDEPNYTPGNLKLDSNIDSENKEYTNVNPEFANVKKMQEEIMSFAEVLSSLVLPTDGGVNRITDALKKDFTKQIAPVEDKTNPSQYLKQDMNSIISSIKGLGTSGKADGIWKSKTDRAISLVYSASLSIIKYIKLLTGTEPKQDPLSPLKDAAESNYTSITNKSEQAVSIIKAIEYCKVLVEKLSSLSDKLDKPAVSEGLQKNKNINIDSLKNKYFAITYKNKQYSVNADYLKTIDSLKQLLNKYNLPTDNNEIKNFLLELKKQLPEQKILTDIRA